MGLSPYANRGNILESLVVIANSQYLGRNMARIDKVPTPGNVHGGFYKDKSTVDFSGVLRGGRAVAFDCKETKQRSLPLKNIHDHQIQYMQDIVDLGGVSFILVHFKSSDEYYRLDLEVLQQYWEKWKEGFGRASIPYEAFTTKVCQEDRIILHYLKGLV